MTTAEPARPGRVFDTAGDLYARARPGYPRGAVEWALPGDPARVADIGAGTGKLTAALVTVGRTVVAIDPSAELLDRLRRTVPGTETRVGTAEATGLGAGWADAITVGAAFHWFARPDADAELARVLRTGGSAALLWNPVDPEDASYAPFAELRTRLGLPLLEFDPDVQLDRRWFDPTRRRDFRHTARMTVDAFVDQFTSRSYVLRLDAGARAEAMARAAELATAQVTDGLLTVGYRTTVLLAIRNDSPVRR